MKTRQSFLAKARPNYHFVFVLSQTRTPFSSRLNRREVWPSLIQFDSVFSRALFLFDFGLACAQMAVVLCAFIGKNFKLWIMCVWLISFICLFRLFVELNVSGAFLGVTVCFPWNPRGSGWVVIELAKAYPFGVLNLIWLTFRWCVLCKVLLLFELRVLSPLESLISEIFSLA